MYFYKKLGLSVLPRVAVWFLFKRENVQKYFFIVLFLLFVILYCVLMSEYVL